MFIFVGRNWKTSIIQKNIIFPGYRAFPDSADRNGHWISVLQVENPKEHLFNPFNSHYHKKTVDNSECHAITATKKSLKTSKRIFFFFVLAYTKYALADRSDTFNWCWTTWFGSVCSMSKQCWPTWQYSRLDSVCATYWFFFIWKIISV